MRVLLIAAPPGGGLCPTIPLGVMYVAAAAARAGHEVQLVDLGFARQPAAELEQAADGWQPDVIGISLRHVAETDALAGVYELYQDLVAAGRRVAPVVVGGSGFSVCPEQLLDLIGADYGIAGPGETVFPGLLARMAGGETEPGVIIRGGAGPWPDVGAVRSEHWRIWGRLYSLAAAPVPILTRRGCSGLCIYCSYPTLEGGTRLRSPGAVAAEMIAVSALPGAGELFIVDAVFNGDSSHAAAVAGALIASGQRCAPWQCCVNPIGLTPAFADLLARAGCVGCDLGVDSLSDAMLSALNKGFTADEAVEAGRTLERAGIPYRLCLIMGGPGETARTINETRSRAASLRPRVVTAFIGIRLYPNTELARCVADLDRDFLAAAATYLAEEARDPLVDLVSAPPDGWEFSNVSVLDAGRR